MEGSAPAPAAPAAPSGGGSAPSSAPSSGGTPASNGASAGTQPATGTSSAPAAQEPRYFTRKEKVDGKEQEFRVTEDELWSAYRKGATVDRRFEQYAAERKKLAEEQAALEAQRKAIAEGDWLSLLRAQRGEKFDPVTELTEKLQALLNDEEKNLDPRNRELAEAKARLAEAEEKERARLQAEAQQQFEAKVAQQRQELGARFTEALKLANLPRNEHTVSLMAQAYRTARQHGLRDIGPEQLAKATEKMATSFVEKFLETEDEGLLLERFPKLTERIHRALVNRYNQRKAQPPPAQKPPENPNTPAERRDSEPRVMRSAEEAKAYGIKGLRTI